MVKRFFYFCILITLSVGCSFFSDSKNVKPNLSTSVDQITETPLEQTVKDPVVESWAKNLAQADAIFREAWRLATNQELGVGKTPFGRVYRPIVRELKVKMSSLAGVTCDKYRIEKKTRPLEWEVFNNCGASDQAWLATVQATAKGFYLRFSVENMKDVLGLQSSILNREISCEFILNNQLLTELKCAKLAKDKNDKEVLRFDSFEYSKTAPVMIYLAGKVLLNLGDSKKFEFKLPQEGRGSFVETELFAPISEDSKIPQVPLIEKQDLSNKANNENQNKKTQPQQVPQGALGGRQEPTAEQEVSNETPNETPNADEAQSMENAEQTEPAESAETTGPTEDAVQPLENNDPRNGR